MPDFLLKPFDYQTDVDEAAMFTENNPEIKKISSCAMKVKCFANLHTQSILKRQHHLQRTPSKMPTTVLLDVEVL